MRIAVFWTGVTAPMAACWRALAERPGVSLTVFTELAAAPDTAYRHEEILAGLDVRVFRAGVRFDRARLRRQIAEAAPDAMLILGWRSPVSRFAAECGTFAAVPKWLAFDMAWEPSLRKFLAPLVLRRYLRRFVGAIVPGERSAVYARHLGFPESRIERGLVGLDTATCAAAARIRASLPERPRRFLHLGRCVPEKRVDLLVAAYRRYRGMVADPWALTCCGQGPESWRLAGVEGVHDLGFVQPAEVPRMLAEHGAFVLASDYDPWPFALAEAVASGLPVVCTSACGNSVELVRSRFNGWITGPGDVEGLAGGLRWIHERGADLAWIGERGMPLTAPYAKEVWAERIVAACGRTDTPVRP